MKTKCILAMLYIGACFSPAPADADVVIDWNATLREAIQLEGDSAGHANPGWSTRAMAMMNCAMYDCVQAIDRTHQPFHAKPEAPGKTSKVAAAVQAAHDVASALYASQVAHFDARAALDLAEIGDGPEKSAGIALGALVAQSYLDWRSGDGSDEGAPYTLTEGVGHWAPDPLHPDQEAWGPAWRSVKTFCMAHGSQFQPPPPPALDSAEYAASLQEVRLIGAKESVTRTADQTQIGFFWAYDRAHLGPPPVLFNRTVSEIAVQKGTLMEQNARLFAMASVAMADAAITAWDCKFVDDFWRPISGIREADNDGNPATLGDPDWEPLGAPGLNGDNFTPPFPAYVSGHATMAEASFRVLAAFFGSDDAEFILTSEELPGVERSYSSFSQASNENAYSRIYLGIHWNFDATEGQILGRRVSDLVTSTYFLALPDPLSISYSDGDVTLEWQGAGALQVSTTLDDDSWQDLPQATSPFAMKVGGESRRFFRLNR